jgi:DNA (cytosine-5)-methyltransferase 1
VRPTLAPFLTEHANASTQRNFAADEPLRTQVAQVKGGHFALVSAFLAKHYGGVVGSELPRPIGTVTSVDHHSLVASSLVKLRGTSKDGQPVTEPLHTISAQGQHHAEVRAFLIKYYGTDQDPQLGEPLHTSPRSTASAW